MRKPALHYVNTPMPIAIFNEQKSEFFLLLLKAYGGYNVYQRHKCLSIVRNMNKLGLLMRRLISRIKLISKEDQFLVALSMIPL